MGERGGVPLKRRGQARLIEAVLTIALLLPFSVYLLYYYAPPSYADPPLHDAAATALITLDENGVLLSLLAENNTAGLAQVFRSSLPGDADFALLYSVGENAPTRLGPAETGANAVQVGYVIVAPNGTVFHLTLLVWRR